jgi:uncharacterized protein (TIGR02284 family)
MSVDKRVTSDLIETLEDGRKGFTEAATKLADTTHPELGARFAEFAQQRADFSAELERMAAAYGDDIDEDGSALAAAHRGWLKLKDVLARSSPEGVLEAAAQGEGHAISEFEDGLSKDISDNLRAVLGRQLDSIRKVEAEVRTLAAQSS